MANDAERLKDWMAQYNDKLYFAIYGILKNREDTADVLQETYLNVYRKMHQFRGDSSIFTWIYRIAIHEALQWIRKNRNKPELKIFQAEPSVHSEMSGEEIIKLLHQAINTLPEKQKRVFVLRYFNELPYEEISEITGTSEGGLKASFHQAVKKVESFIKENYEK